MTYENFDIHIGQANKAGEYPIVVADSGGGGKTREPVWQLFPLDDHNFGDPVDYVRDLMADSDEAVALGRWLTTLLFPKPVWDLFMKRWGVSEEKKKSLRLRLRIDPPELSLLPWELCYSDEAQDYFALTPETPLLRYIAEPFEEGDISAVPAQVKVLLAIANPLADLDVAREEQHIRDALAPLGERVTLVVCRDVTRDLLHDALNDEQPHILHFVGHGKFIDGQGALLLADDSSDGDPLFARQIKSLVRGAKKNLKVVVLNACHSARPGVKEAAQGVAQMILRTGIPAVIAMQTIIPDAIAVRFAQVLYKHLADGKSLDIAVTEMRVAANLHSYFGCIPVLFMRDSGEARVWQPRPAAVESDGQVGRAGETAVFTPLLTLNYKDQNTAFGQCEENVTGLLISGALGSNNKNNLRLLLKRLIKAMPYHVTTNRVRFSLSSDVGPGGGDGFWFQLAHHVGVPVDDFADPYSDEDKQRIVQGAVNQLETRHVVMILEELEPKIFSILLQDFWLPLVLAIHEADPDTLSRRLLMFLVDNFGYHHLVDVYGDISAATHFHVDMPPVETYTAPDLTEWIQIARVIATDNRMQTFLDRVGVVDEILGKSQGGKPEDALKYICTSCGYDWDGAFEKWLKP